MTSQLRGTIGPKTTHRRRRAARPGCEALEGRALLAYYSALDPTFGQAGVVLGPSTGAGLSDGYAVAIGTDGKLVEAGTIGAQALGSNSYPQLAVRRFNADGSVDTGFGTNGQANVALPATAVGIQVGPQNVVVQADGSILVAATAALPGTNPGVPRVTEGFVAKLTSGGQLDTTFGTGGEYVLTGTTTSAASVAVDGVGNVLVLGGDNATIAVPFGGTQSATANRLILTRLTSTGAPDTTFNGTGSLAIPLPTAQLNAGNNGFALDAYYNYVATALAIASNGQIYVAGNDVVSSTGLSTYYADLSRVNANGTLDTTFGTGGTTAVGQYLIAARVGSPSIEAMAFDGDGKLLVVGNTEDAFTYRGFINRLLPDGTLDATFAGNSPTDGSVFQKQISGLTYTSIAIGGDGSINVGANFLYNGGGSVVRFTPAGASDAGFGMNGLYQIKPSVPAPAGQTASTTGATIAGIAATPDGKLVVAGTANEQSTNGTVNQFNLLARLQVVPVVRITGDYDGDLKSDIAVYLPGLAAYADRPSAGSAGDVIQGFGAPGSGVSIPAPGDYDGDGKTDIAVYIPSQGRLWYRTNDGYGNPTDQYTTLGGPGDIPAPGDYDGNGRTDITVFDPATASFIIRDSIIYTTQTIAFGAPGAGNSIPAPGDYDGDGKTDLAVYLPAIGALAYRPSSGGPDVVTSFGIPGDRASIPVPGDYDGDGKTDIAVYIPGSAIWAYRPSSGRAGDPDVWAAFGVVGDGATIPAPGDYDGDGKTDIAAYIPGEAIYAYRPSSAAAGDPDVWTGFGTPGDGVTIPVTSIPYAQPPTVSGMSLASSAPPAGVPLALTDDVLATLAGPRKKRP